MGITSLQKFAYILIYFILFISQLYFSTQNTNTCYTFFFSYSLHILVYNKTFLQQMFSRCFPVVRHVYKFTVGNELSVLLSLTHVLRLGPPLDRVPSSIPSVNKLRNSSTAHAFTSKLSSTVLFFQSTYPIVLKMSSFVLLSVQLILYVYLQHRIFRAFNITFTFLFIFYVSLPQKATLQTYLSSFSQF